MRNAAARGRAAANAAAHAPLRQPEIRQGQRAQGPSTDQAIVWVFQRAGLPVEVIAESENWRRVRDSEGADGWVFHSLLSGRRTALVAPWTKGEENVPLYSIENRRAPAPSPSLQAERARQRSLLRRRVVQLSIEDYSGYVQQDKLWGVYRGEDVK